MRGKMNRIAGRLLRRGFASPSRSIEVEPLLKPARTKIELDTLTAASFSKLNTVYDIPLKAKEGNLMTLPVSILKSFSELNTSGLLLTQQTKDIWMEILHNPNYSALLDGPKGIGKSSTLVQLVCAAMAGKDPEFLVMYAPSMARWTAGYYPYQPNRGDKSKFDQPKLAQGILDMFSFINKNKKLNPEMTALLEANSDPLERLTSLLESLQTVPGKRVLFALDQINALYTPTQYCDQDGKTLGVEDFTVLSAIKKASSSQSISVVAGTCRSDPLIRDPKWDESASRLTANIKELRPFRTEEVRALLDHYQELGHSYKSGPKYTKLISFVSGGIPANITRACDYETIYTA